MFGLKRKPPYYRSVREVADNDKKPKNDTTNSPKKFIYGNYNRYYGYRNPSREPDGRLSLMKKEWFEGKNILDVGCNVGQVTLAIATNFLPKTIVGMDIDRELILVAKKNIRHCLIDNSDGDLGAGESACDGGGKTENGVDESKNSSASNDIKRVHLLKSVFFIHGNYVPEDDGGVDLVIEEYDVILALSITKWIHFNFGDDGLKRSFKKMYKQLRVSGLLVLEAQEWSSYKKKKKLSDTIYQNYLSIQFKPDQFLDYLTNNIGFQLIDTLLPKHVQSKGFQRPIWIMQK
ncbi:hypothetical protein HELRODRAFT_110926 [Helobdella robusta]|uniref:RNA methyltransferase n=1 Tax=Helobdella robusta TaxID=6412 RepID=T1EF63_HELRO|nr:hypothetical protein HELRODRAFT_110926 [Helobdella robusta]ESO06888.1 hypothetical protein HELRODRAFT_110926 [Helobdella robusta]